MLPEKPKVELITTDGFLYPNAELERRGILNKKGFPESYDAKSLLAFLAGVKSGKELLEAPVYSHLYYDIIPGKTQLITKPDILIVEGVNVLQVSLDRKPRRRALSPILIFQFLWMQRKRISANGTSKGSKHYRKPHLPTPTPISINMLHTATRSC